MGKNVGAVVIPTSAPGGGLVGSNNIVIGSLWNGLGDLQGTTLVHEEVHWLTGMNDSQVWNFAQSQGAVANPNNSNPSWNFSNWIYSGCPDQGSQ